MQVVNHEVEWGVSHGDLAFQHQEQMRPPAQFENADLWTLKYRTHANGPHKASRFLHAVCLQNDVRHGQRWALMVFAHIPVGCLWRKYYSLSCDAVGVF